MTATLSRLVAAGRSPSGVATASSALFSGTSFLVSLSLGLSSDAAVFALFSTLYVAMSLLSSLLRAAVYDRALLTGSSRRLGRSGAEVFTSSMSVLLLGAAGLSAALALGDRRWLLVGACCLALGADCVRMLCHVTGRRLRVLVLDGAWFAATGAGCCAQLLGSGSGVVTVGLWAGGAALGVGGGILIGGVRPSPRFGSVLDRAGLALGLSGGGAFAGSALSLFVLGLAGRPGIVALLGAARLVAMPSLVVYTGLRVGLLRRGAQHGRRVVVLPFTLVGAGLMAMVGLSGAVFWVLSLLGRDGSAFDALGGVLVVAVLSQALRVVGVVALDFVRIRAAEGVHHLGGIGSFVAASAFPLAGAVLGGGVGALVGSGIGGVGSAALALAGAWRSERRRTTGPALAGSAPGVV